MLRCMFGNPHKPRLFDRIGKDDLYSLRHVIKVAMCKQRVDKVMMIDGAKKADRVDWTISSDDSDLPRPHD